ncbi:hypothetical protein N9937_02055 [bacterium]|nr:hypothetical protein [bacterium]
MKLSDVEKKIIETIREDGESNILSDPVYYCETCQSMQYATITTVSGRVGHIDNWLPDEQYYHCQTCGEVIE